MPTPGKLELTIKINQVPANVKTMANGWKQFEIDIGAQIVTLTLKPGVFKQLEQAQENYPDWVAVIAGQMSKSDRGFLLKDCGVTVYPLHTFARSYLPNTELQKFEPTIAEGVEEKEAAFEKKSKQSSRDGRTGEEVLKDNLSQQSPPAAPALGSLQQNATSYEILLRSKSRDAKGLVFMKKLIKGVEDFKANYFSTHQELFEELSHGQKPKVLFITCSDSRIDPNLITQTQMGELFVIRNAGNIIPPFGAANGGEGAAMEYAIHSLDIEQIIVCGHSRCGAMEGLLQLNKLQEKMPLVYDWLKHAEATRRLVQENYGNYQGEELLDIAIAENALTQIENLKTYPVIRSKLNQGKLQIDAWIYRIETGEVLAYDPVNHAYVFPQCHLPDYHPEHEPTPGQFISTSAPPALIRNS